MKFKVGDRVRVIRTDEGAHNAVIGDIGTIKYIRDTVLPYAVEFDNERIPYHTAWWSGSKYCKSHHGYWCSDKMLELVNAKPETIVIYRKGNETIALDKRTGRKAVAKCCPEDTYNFDTGAELAFKRLMDLPTFGPRYKEVKRRANAGEYVKIINAKSVPKSYNDTPCYKNGDIINILNNDDIFGRARFRKGTDANGREYVLLDDEYVVLEGYKPEHTKTDDKIKVGDTVKVVNAGLTYSAYIDWVEIHIRDGRDLRYKLDYGHSPSISSDYKVKYIAKHLSSSAVLAYIQNLYTDRCYVVDIKGLKKC